MADIFISYSREDRDRVRQLANALEAEGYSLWWDHNLSAGGRFVSEIEEELEAARVVLVVWSEYSVRSMWVADEANVGLERNILVPVSVDGVRPKLGFRQIQTIDLSDWQGKLPSGFDQLRSALATRLDPDAQVDTGEPAQNMAGKPWILMEEIGVPSGDDELQELAEALTDEIGSGLARFPHLLVSSGGRNVDGTSARYAIRGSLRRGGRKLRLTMQLRNLARGSRVWGDRYDRETDDILDLDIQDDLVDHVVSAIADPYGALVRDLCVDVEHKDLQSQSAYELSLRQFIYKQTLDAEGHRVLREAAKLAVERDPNDPNTWALLAHSCIEEFKHEFSHEPGARNRALQAARKAVELGRNNAYAHFQLAEIQFFRRDLGAFRAATERAIELNPRDSESMAMLGILMGYAGDWARCVAMTDRAMDLNPDHPGWYRFGQFFYQYLQGNDEQALELAERINMPNYFPEVYARCICHAQLGHEQAAREALEEFRKLWSLGGKALKELNFERWMFAQPELIRRVEEGLKKAGYEFE